MEVFKGMFSALVIIGEFDVLQDKRENFFTNALAQMHAVKAAIAQACECLKNAFK